MYEKEIAKGDEYKRITSFMELSDEDDEVLLDNIPDTVTKTYVSAPSQMTLPQIGTQSEKDENDKTAIRRLLNAELGKRLNQKVLTAAKTTDVSDKAKVDVNDGDTHISSRLDDHPIATINDKQQPRDQSKLVGVMPYQTRDKTMNMKSFQADLKNKFAEANKGLATSMKEIEAITSTKGKKLPDTMEPNCSNETMASDTVGSFEGATFKTGGQDYNQQDHHKTSNNQSEQKIHDQNTSELNDEKKALAVERSLNAANYLLQNWGFGSRTSIKQKKFDLETLQFGKSQSY